MGVNRRGFLKAAALGALGAAGGKAGFELLSGEEVLASAAKKSEGGTRWAMAIDLRKFDEVLAKRVMNACHITHNVPTKFDLERKDERRWNIQWIWTEEYENTFPSQGHHHIAEQIKKVPVPVLCNHCDKIHRKTRKAQTA